MSGQEVPPDNGADITNTAVASPQAGPTLLPGPVAKAVSLATRSTSLAIRVGSLAGYYSLDAARVTTLSSLELARSVVESILSRAARDTLAHSGSELATADAETVLERSLESVHFAVSQVVFWTSASFRLTGTTLAAASEASQLLLSSLDKLFGSTDSSRAMASIITLIRREFNNPVTGASGEKVGVIDLILASTALAYLQQACRRSVPEERRRRAYEEIIWDVVVLDDGQRVDIQDSSREPTQPPTSLQQEVGQLPEASLEDDEAALQHLKNQISSSLSPGTSVSISSSVSTVQTITVDVHGPQLLSLPTPPGAEIVETRRLPSPTSSRWSWKNRRRNGDPYYRVIYKIERDKATTTSLRGEEEDPAQAKVDFISDGPPPKSSESGQYDDSSSASTAVARSPAAILPPPSPSSASASFWNSGSRVHDSTDSVDDTKLSPLPAHEEEARRSVPSRQALQRLDSLARSNSRASYVSVHEHRRGSIVSRADFPLQSNGGTWRAAPTLSRTAYSTQEYTMRPHGETHCPDSVPPSPRESRCQRPPSPALSLHKVMTNDSQSSMVLSSYYQKSAYNASDALVTLRREGFVDGMFPAGHLLPNMARYMRFSSACYGSHFLRFSGISTDMPALGVWDGTHHDVRHFMHHTECQAGNVLLASFVDPQGGSDSTGSTGTGIPLVHYISLDHDAKAVVLACRGTLGFEDVLADLACDYDDMNWRGHRYQVHKGIHASARRLLYGADGRVLATIGKALLDHPEYGLILCGHSLGGGVTSLLGVMLAEPNPDGVGFVISAEPHMGLITQQGASGAEGKPVQSGLPTGRRIHVYAYGAPGVMSPSLRNLTRGLITSVVHGNDLVPHLSLGLLHDFRALALAFNKDETGSKAEIRQRMWQAFQSNVADTWSRTGPRVPGEGDDRWLLPVLETLRENMNHPKLVPPGEVFVIETMRVLRRDAFILLDEGPVGRPAHRVVVKYIRDVEARFREVRFGTSILTDHSPAKYEDALNKARLGVIE